MSNKNLDYPDSYADCVRILSQENILPTALADRLIKAIGLRIILVHEYTRVDDDLLLDALEQLDDFRAFAKNVLPHI